LTVISLTLTALARHWLPSLLMPVASLLLGASFAGLTFLGHETLHGAVVRNKAVRHIVGWIGFLPFAISPRLWVAWHNGVHHGNTQRAGKDPDAYPTLAEYHGSLAVRVATEIAPGRGRLRGLTAPLIGFTVQSAHMLVVSRSRGYLSPRAQRWAIAETLLGVGVWSAVAFAVGGVAFLFGFVAPLLVANVIVMGFILTNHSLSPLTGVNDPLVNSLSVTPPRLITWLTLGFGFHVEHHLFPAMSTRHASGVRAVLRARWPDLYQSMSLARATAALHMSPRIYKDASTLVDPGSGREWPTLRRAVLAPLPAE
jgi:fatty acid desaturase